MKHLFLATALLASGLSLSAQTLVTTPFQPCKPTGIAFRSSNVHAFSVHDDEKGYSIYDISLSELFSLPAQESSKLLGLYIYDYSVEIPDDDTDYVDFTQRLFNDDDAFEYFMAEYDNDTPCTKISLRTSASKDPVFSLEPGVEMNPSGIDIYVAYFGKELPFYIILSTYFDSGYQWYKYEPKTGAVEKVAAESVPALVARPNPVKAGEVVNLGLREACGQCSIAVFTMRGELVETLTTTDGTLNTAGLTPGHYLYKVAGNGRQVGTGRLIIK